MEYNYYYSLVSAFFLVSILVCLGFKFMEKTPQNKRYIRLVAGLLVACIAEVISCFTFRNVTEDTVTLNMLINAIDFCSITVTTYFYGLYIEGFIHEGKHVMNTMRIINDVILVVYCAAHVVNIWGHMIYYFDESYTYCHGPIYHVVIIIPMYFILYGIIQLIIHRKILSSRQMISMMTFSILITVASVVQYVIMPLVLISLCAGAIGAVIIFFFLETPDFKILLDTMEDLKKAEEVAQEERIKAYAANQAKSSFLANVSHEIRTPINAVLGMNEMILRESSEEKVKEYAMDVNAAGMSLLSIINDILDISKIEAGKMEVIPAEYELASMIDALVNMTSVRAMKKGLDFNIIVDENLPSRLLGDDLRLKQIIMNLLSNGVKYTKEGSVTLDVSGKRNDNILLMKVSVTDTGIGIKEEELAGLFEEFQRLDERKNRNIEGTGLGMSIANELLNIMGSQINVESEYGVGSTFYFEVEQEIIDDTPVGNIQEKITDQASNYEYKVTFTAPESKILVVDDNSINRKVVAGLLKGIGCQIDEASGGYECLDMVKLKHYDLIFLDHLMPDLDGVWTLEKIKSEENMCNDTPVIAFTANAVSGMKESFLATGFSGFISKPVDSNRLEELLLEFLPKEQIHEGQVVEAETGVEEALPDLDDFDFRYAKVCLGQSNLIKSVAADFYDQADRIKSALENYVSHLDEEECISHYRTDVHALKSTSRMLGEITLSGLCKASEDAAKAKDKETVLMLHPLVLAELEKAKEELEELIPKKEEITKSSIDNNILKTKLEELKTILDARDVKAADNMAAELSEYEYSDDISEKMSQLIEFIKILKMLKASALIDELLEVVGGE